MDAGWTIASRFTVHDPARDLLGRGGMGEVYKAADTQTGETVAVKILNPQVVQGDPELLERFTREGEALRQLNHPNIVRMVTAFEEDGQHYLVMEYVAGGSLEDLLEQERQLPAGRVVEISLDLADALTRAHRLGILHRDLKPANILLAEDGTPRLADFGIAHQTASPRLTQTGVLVGTVDYLSPEVCQGEPPDERSDIWSFGVLLYQMLSGELPFSGKSLTAKITAILTQPVPDLAQSAPETPDALVDLVYRMLEKDPIQRIPSIRQVGLELESILKGWETPISSPLTKTPSFTQQPSFLKTGEVVGLPADLKKPVFVTRQNELERLDAFLNQALGGQSRVAFITGDPGQGKTALAQEFAWRAQKGHSELLVASGNCNAYTGIGDPYLPFREILGLLSGDIEPRWEARAMDKEQVSRLWQAAPLTVQVLLESGRDLVDIFVSGDSLIRRAATFAPWPERDVWLPRLKELVERKATIPGDPNFQQSALFEQYARLLRGLSHHNPLLLFLDDLQWADSGSTNLLFQLGKGIGGSRVMILGAYRPNEVALGRGGERHPLEPIVNEFKRQFGDIQIDLGKTDGRQFVDAFLDSEPNRLGKEFRATLYRLSGGQPLGTIELIRDMQERGGLVHDSAGRWVEGQALDWETLPARVEGMIAERIDRLEDSEQQALKIASVEGETFTAEIIAQIQGANENEIVSLLSNELDKKHHLVSAQNIRYLNGKRLSTYRFRHILFQRYLYNRLDPVECPQLHQAVGKALQALYGEGTEQIAGQLARHFQEAGTMGTAADYLEQAGDRANELVAHKEAIDYYRQAKTAYEDALGDRWEALSRAKLEGKIGECFFRKGERQPALEHTKQALTYLGRPLPSSHWGTRLAIVTELFKLFGHRLMPGLSIQPGDKPISPSLQAEVQFYSTIAWIEFLANPEGLLLLTLRGLNASERHGFLEGFVSGAVGFGLIIDYLGLFQLSESYFKRAVTAAEKTQNPRALGMAHLGMASHQSCLGNIETAYRHAQLSTNAWELAGDRRNQGYTEFMQAAYLAFLGKFAQSFEICNLMILQGRDRVDPQLQCWGLTVKGGVVAGLGDFDQAINILNEAVVLSDSIRDYGDRIEAGGDLGRCYARQGKFEKAIAELKEARRIYTEYGTAWGYDVAVFNGLADVYLRVVDHNPTERAKKLKEAEQACRAALKHARLFRSGLPEALRLRGTCEWFKGDSASAQRWWQRSLQLAAGQGQQFEVALTHREIGLRLRKRDHLECAEAMLAEIGAQWDLARTREALGKL